VIPSSPVPPHSRFGRRFTLRSVSDYRGRGRGKKERKNERTQKERRQKDRRTKGRKN
jgi:hypothetical protein